MRPQRLAPVLALTLATLGGVADAQPNTIAPGYWETTNQVISPVHSSKVERRCIKPQDIAKFMDGPSNHIYHCTYPTRVVGDGTIRLRGSCASRDGKPFPISGDGSFTRDTFHMDARIVYPFGPLNIPGHAVTDARRLGPECPTDTEASASGQQDAQQPSVSNDPPSNAAPSQ
jgi:hypothetical protein